MDQNKKEYISSLSLSFLSPESLFPRQAGLLDQASVTKGQPLKKTYTDVSHTLCQSTN